MVKEDLIEEVIEVKRLDDRMMKIAMVCGMKILHAFSVYALQQCRPEEGKEFLKKPRREKNMLGLCQEHNLRVLKGRNISSHTRVELLKVR